MRQCSNDRFISVHYSIAKVLDVLYLYYVVAARRLTLSHLLYDIAATFTHIDTLGRWNIASGENVVNELQNEIDCIGIIN